ncbi:MAG: MFS transporter [Chloroflexi bacterium]|nr:MFS transporter [Chloroflexota bacterium]
MKFGWTQYITINAYWLGLATLSQTMAPLVLPLLIEQFVGEAQKATYYGTLRLWGLMVALLAQAFWGLLSDASTLRWGRRRPFILGGAVLNLVFIVAIGFSAGMSGFAGYVFLFAMYVLLQISANAAHGATQGLIPDLVPENQRGKFSGVKAILEVPLPVIIVSFTVGRLIQAGNMWGALFVAMGVVLATALLTMFVREQAPQGAAALVSQAWSAFARLVLMTALFTGIILGLGEAVRLGSAFTDGLDASSLFIAMGLLGLLAMSIAIALGVWVSVRIGAGDATRNPSFTWWIVNRLAFLAGAVNLSSFAIFFLQARLGLVREKAAGPAANMLLFVGVFVLIFASLAGWLSDRIGHTRVVAFAGALAAFGTAVAIAAPDLNVIYAGACIIGAAIGMFYTANWALGTRLVPPDQAARYLGISNLAGAGAGAVGAYIGGPIADLFTARFPDLPGLGYVLLFAMYGALFLLSMLALARVKDATR